MQSLISTPPGRARGTWDVAFALYWFVPLYHNDLPTAPGLGDLASAAARLQLFCDAYGIPADATLLELVERRLHALCIHLITRALHGEAVYRTMLAEGHLAGYQRAILDLQQAHPQLLAALHKSM